MLPDAQEGSLLGGGDAIHLRSRDVMAIASDSRTAEAKSQRTNTGEPPGGRCGWDPVRGDGFHDHHGKLRDESTIPPRLGSRDSTVSPPSATAKDLHLGPRASPASRKPPHDGLIPGGRCGTAFCILEHSEPFEEEVPNVSWRGTPTLGRWTGLGRCGGHDTSRIGCRLRCYAWLACPGLGNPAMRRRSLNPVVATFGRLSRSGRALTRWSIRVLVASLLLGDLTPIAVPARSLFDSLARELRDATICSARTPIFLAIVGIVVGYRLVAGSLWSSLAIQFLGAVPQGLASAWRSIRAVREEVLTLMAASELRTLSRRLVLGGWTAAIVSGAASTGFASWLLLTVSPTRSLLLWLPIVAVSLVITRLEHLVTEHWYSSHGPRLEPPTRDEAATRLQNYLSHHPFEAPTASPLLYAHSGLDRDEIQQRFLELGATGGTGRIGRLGFVVLVATFYPLLPPADLGRLADDGYLGCVFIGLHDFFRVAQENLILALTAAVIALALLPIAVVGSYLRFMREWRFPFRLRWEVVRRELGFAHRMVVYLVVITTATAAAGTLVLWVGARLAVRLDSPPAGLAVLVLGPLAAILLVRRFRHA
jgi:hypothetical protein